MIILGCIIVFGLVKFTISIIGSVALGVVDSCINREVKTENQVKTIEDKDIPEQELYIYTQLEGWSKELKANRELIKEYEFQIDMINNLEKKGKMNKKIASLNKQLATNEKNIRTVCYKYGLDCEEYL